MVGTNPTSRPSRRHSSDSFCIWTTLRMIRMRKAETFEARWQAVSERRRHHQGTKKREGFPAPRLLKKADACLPLERHPSRFGFMRRAGSIRGGVGLPRVGRDKIV